MEVLNAMDFKKGKKTKKNRFGVFTQPIQFIPADEKDDEWSKHNLDWLEWQGIKQIIISRSKELSPKVFSDILVLSTLESKQETNSKAADLFSSVEADLIISMKSMALDDLLNLMWSALEIDRGSQFFF